MNREFFCRKCGKKFDGINFIFCPFCGNKIDESAGYIAEFCSELLKGNDPSKSEMFSDGINVITPEVNQIIKTVLKHVNIEQKKINRKDYHRRGHKWSEEEDRQLKEEYLGKLPLHEICNKHERSLRAIQLRIIRLFPEIIQGNKRQDSKSEDKVIVGSKVTYLDKRTGEICQKLLLPPKYEEKPIGGTGAYHELKTKKEVIPPNISKNEISSESSFGKQILGRSTGELVQIFPNIGKPFYIEIQKVEN